jgi:hypothetical protein
MKPGRHEPKGGRGKGVFVIGSHVNDLNEFDFYNQFLGGSLFREVTAKSLKHAALLVKKSVLQELRTDFANAFTRGGYYYVGAGSGYKKRDGSTKRQYNDSMGEAVRVGKLKGGWNHQEIKVHILGTRAKGSGTYRLRFYEGGGSRLKRGDIPGHHFFWRGQKQINIWHVVKENLDKYLKDNGWM